MAENSTSTTGVSVLGLLGVAFVVLKLCNVIDWSWWWVTLPFWIGIPILLIVIIITGMTFLFFHFLDKK